jgi:uncharacterized protein with PQ loop repeat
MIHCRPLMSLLTFCAWLAETRGSIALRESLLMYPLIESIHVWTLTLFVGFAAVLDLRLLGLTLRRTPVSDVAQRLLPWTIAGFIVMVISGVLLFYAIPVRTYQSVWFRFKLVFLVLAGINIWVFHSGTYRRVQQWNLAMKAPKPARLAGIFSLVLWGLIIIFGRNIAYNWFDCDRQPQPALVNFLAGCQVD